jgi:hypothetical protein
MGTNAQHINLIAPEVSQGLKDAIMAVRGVDPLAAYNGSKEVELAEADLYSRMSLSPEFTEGALSIKYNATALKAAANRLYLKWNDDRYDGGAPLITSINL